ncbi:MAG: lipid IV(A) 3-deoxy-D-manno-octulosonic acid transferase [Methyloprofundus sp.]|nr:lipid IV(A) 3-deoxy-D-manno-octulosonic acid transferase [Methyloprofundus sp.]MBW6452517.1 lipid IV(A) 3-deoxy-D-manno-octulosonic acid transferase [Methyloprofundus sp.]
MYYFYVALFYLLLPFLLVFRYFKGLKSQNFNARFYECLGFYTQKHAQGVVWLHAASVGEVEAAHVLIEYLRKNYPYKVLVTTGTAAGYERVRALQDGQVEHVYLPYDMPRAVERFIKHFQPRIAIIMETEIWPVLFARCNQHEIPLFIVNARLTEKSRKGYVKLKGFLAKAFAGISGVVVQTSLDARRYQEIGVLAEKISISGNIKLDMPIADTLKVSMKQVKQALLPGRQVFVVGSTHAGEDEIFLQVYRRLKSKFPELLLVLVPRQPKRASEIKKLCLKNKLNVLARTEHKSCDSVIDVYLVDTLGELKQMYALADFSFVAGSMVPVGGHNIFEPILLGVPVMFGPYMQNVELLAKQLLEAQGAIQCATESDIVLAITQMIEDPQEKRRLISNAQVFVEKNNGAIGRTIALIDPFLRAHKATHLPD